MGAEQSRSRDLVMKSAAGDVEGVRHMLAIYMHQQRHPELATQLPLHHRIDINHQLPEGDFALELATTHGHVGVVELLLEHGCNADAQDADGLTALMCAAHDSSTEITLQLLRLGRANPNVQDSGGHTALHYASQLGHVAQVSLLLSYGASPSIRNVTGLTALGAAAQNGQWRALNAILSALRAQPPPVSSTDDKDADADADAEEALASLVHDAAALRPAAEAGEWETVQLLLECGADPQERLPSGGRVVDLLPSFLLSSLATVRSNRRADRVVRALYPFLTGSLVETVLEYDEESYEAPGRCVALARLLHHIRKLGAQQDRLEAEQRRLGMAAGLTSRSSQSPSSAAALPYPSPSPSPAAPSGIGGRIAPPSRSMQSQSPSPYPLAHYNTASPEPSPAPFTEEQSQGLQALQSPPAHLQLPVSLRSAIEQSQGDDAPLELMPFHSDGRTATGAAPSASSSSSSATAAAASSSLSSRLRVPLGAPRPSRSPASGGSASMAGICAAAVEGEAPLLQSRGGRRRSRDADSDSDDGSEARSSSPLHPPRSAAHSAAVNGTAGDGSTVAAAARRSHA